MTDTIHPGIDDITLKSVDRCAAVLHRLFFSAALGCCSIFYFKILQSVSDRFKLAESGQMFEYLKKLTTIVLWDAFWTTFLSRQLPEIESHLFILYLVVTTWNLTAIYSCHLPNTLCTPATPLSAHSHLYVSLSAPQSHHVGPRPGFLLR